MEQQQSQPDQLSRGEKSQNTTVQTSLKDYYHKIQKEQLGRYKAGKNDNDLTTSQLKVHNAYTPLQRLQSELSINSPENMIQRNKCEILEDRLNHVNQELLQSQRKLQEFKFKDDNSIGQEEYRKLVSQFKFEQQMKDKQIQEQQQKIEHLERQLAEMQGQNLICQNECDLKVINAEYRREARIIHVNTLQDREQIPDSVWQKKYNELLLRHEESIKQVIKMSDVLEGVKKENNQLILENLDMKKSNCDMAARMSQLFSSQPQDKK